MSKIIRMTPEMIEESKRKFEARLQNMNLANGTLTYTETFQATNQKAVVWITPDAYTKMIALIQDSDKEVAWHGVAHRLEAEGQYVITDILVYPQEVTGATVNTDQAEYEQWMMNLEDDVFNNLRMQGMSLADFVKYTGMDLDTMREQFKPQAESFVKIRLALEKIAELENITASEEEVEAEYTRLAEAYQMDADAVKGMIPADSIAEDLKVKAAMELVKANAVAPAESAE
jgi:hypothetical protein